MPGIVRFIQDFYERNLFERIVIYLFLSGFIVKFLFEFLLGQWSFEQAQNAQWIFYALLALDYIVSFRKVVNVRVTVNPMSLLALTFLVMVAHGLFVGILSRNQPFVILNDTVPLLMIALNILRMQSFAEFRPIDFRFLIKACTYLAIGACFFGFAAQLLGKPSQPSLGNGSIYLPLILAAMYALRPFPVWIGVAAVIMISLTLADMNRTTMVFFAVIVGAYVLIRLIKNPAHGVGVLIAVVMVSVAAWVMVPEDSKTYERIANLGNIDLSQRTGSIGERQAEWEAIRAKLENKGPTYEWLGLGFGGLYEVQFTHQYNTNYGHAHYSWAWFSLRFGNVGFIYLALFVSALAWNLFSGVRRADEQGFLIAFLCLMGLIYCATYVNGVFLLSGIHFFHDIRGRALRPSVPAMNLKGVTT